MKKRDEHSQGMTRLESRAALSLGAIYALRMLGLFLILPVFAFYAEELADVTPLLVGVAIGAYGLTQALLQIPFGMLSDRIGRKPVIVGGLLVFALGSVIAAQADSIWGVVIGRAIQGSGAIAAAVMALAADLTQEHNRVKAMAVIGMSIGLAFALSMILGPVFNAWIGVDGIFWMTAVLALAGVGITLFLVPNPRQSHFHRDTEPVPGQFHRVLTNPELLRLDTGIMVLHMAMTALFLVLPLSLRDLAGLDPSRHWLVYFPVLVASVILMVPCVVIAEKRRRIRGVFLLAIGALALTQLGFFAFRDSLWGLVASLVLYFTAFNVLEATLPSLVSKMAPAESKGTAMGVYSTAQFGGAFLGGLVGGWMHTRFGMGGVFLFAAAAVSVWLVVAAFMSEPRYLRNHLLNVGILDASRALAIQDQLLGIDGVDEAVVVAGDEVAYLKIDPLIVDMSVLDAFSAARG